MLTLQPLGAGVRGGCRAAKVGPPEPSRSLGLEAKGQRVTSALRLAGHRGRYLTRGFSAHCGTVLRSAVRAGAWPRERGVGRTRGRLPKSEAPQPASRPAAVPHSDSPESVLVLRPLT